MPFFVNAQVIIKEKVEINPTKRFIVNFPINLPDTTGTKSANELLINKSQNKLENTQSIISLPEGGRVTVQIIGSDAAASSKIDLLLRQPEQQTLVEYANHEPGFSWTSPGYPPGSSVEFGIYWYWNNWGTIYQGNEAGALITQIDDDMYQIGFEAAGDDWDYNELVIDVKVETYLPLVLIDPPNISTGETAVVSVKKQYYDGRVEDFPTGQLFEFGMMEGCDAGGLVSGADTATYFNGVTQPMLFVAADSLENDEETVKIGVGLIEGTSGGEIIDTKIAEADQVKQKVKNELLNRNPENINALIIGGNCFGGEFQSAKIGFGDVVVKDNNKWCDSLIICNSNEYLPNIILNQVPNGYNGRDICTDRPADGDPLEGVQCFWNEDINITSDICFNPNQDRLWYSDISPLNINYILAICNPNVTTYQLIDDWTEISDTLECNELEDIYIPIRIYGGRAMPPLPGYYLRVVINAHENEHKIDYQTAIDQALPEFNQALQNLVKQCADFNDEAAARLTLNSFLIKYFKELKRNASNNFNTIKESAKNRSGDYETDVQHRRSVIDEINRQIAATNTARNCNISLFDYYY